MSFGINFFISILASSCKLRAHGKEKETRRPVPSKMGATRRWLANTSFSCVRLSIRPQIRTVSSQIARYRAILPTHFAPQATLAPHCHAQGAYIPAGIKCSQ
jgi:hypothetical protein